MQRGLEMAARRREEDQEELVGQQARISVSLLGFSSPSHNWICTRLMSWSWHACRALVAGVCSCSPSCAGGFWGVPEAFGVPSGQQAEEEAAAAGGAALFLYKQTPFPSGWCLGVLVSCGHHRICIRWPCEVVAVPQ